MGGNIELLRPLLPRELPRELEQPPADPPPAQLLRDVRARQVAVGAVFAERAGLHRRKALEHPALECPEHRAAGMDRIPQTGHQKRKILLRPVVGKDNVPNLPLAVDFPPAAGDLLPPDKPGKQRPVDFPRRQPPILHTAPSPSAAAFPRVRPAHSLPHSCGLCNSGRIRAVPFQGKR